MHYSVRKHLKGKGPEKEGTPKGGRKLLMIVFINLPILRGAPSLLLLHGHKQLLR